MGCMLIVIVFVNIFQKTEGNKNFFTDFLKFFNIENPVFISTDELDQDLSNISKNSPTASIRYNTNKDEEEIAGRLQKLQLLGDLTAVVFIDNGHQKLLDLLINDLKLFNIGLTGLFLEADVTTGLNLTLRLDSKLYLYTSLGETIDLKEMYAINKKKIVHSIGTWRENTGLTATATNMWERRTNMEGMLIRVATINFPCLHELHYDKSGESIIGGSGFFLEPLNILAKDLNFTLKLMPSYDGQWGAMNSNGTWNGMIGMLENEQADIAGAAFSVTEARGRVVTFGRAIAENVVTLISAATIKPEANPWIYIEVFPHTAWCVCCGMVISISTCFAIINNSGLNYMHDKFDSEKFTIMNGLGLSLAFFRQIYYDVNIKCISTKLLFILSAVTTYLLYIHYTAYLTAASTHGKKSQISSFRDVISSGMNVFVKENTANHDLLRYAKSGTAMSKVYQETTKNRPGAFLQSYTDVPKILASKKNLLYAGDLHLKASYTDLTFISIQGLLELIKKPNIIFCLYY